MLFRSELIKFLSKHLDIFLDCCQKYIKLYDDLNKNCAYLTNINNEKVLIEKMINLQEVANAETITKLDIVIKNVK